MPYWLKFALYLIVAWSVTFVLASLLGPLGRVINVLFSFAAAYLAVIIGRRVLR
jgi:hypothetical protein